MVPATSLCFSLLLCMVGAIYARGCDRSRSRLVRKVVYEKLLPAFSAFSTELSDECIFSPSRDRYRTQESHKSVEDGVQWHCHFCGKAFTNEYFLDLHFDNRHTDQLEEDSLCLADVCEVFRCDVIGRNIIPDFWDVALCLEDDMKSLHRKCASVVHSCVPSGLTENMTRSLTEKTMKDLCSYLTCSKYWETPFESNIQSGMTGLYIIMVVMTIFGVIIYYFVFFTYFFTDTFADVPYSPPARSHQSSRQQQADLRHRPRVFPAAHID